MQIFQTIIRFPEIELMQRDAHKLRGYFGNLFKKKSPLLHNHLEGGELRYAYPKVQYKVIDRTPLLIGMNEGAELLNQLFLKIKEIDIDGKKYPVQHKNIEGVKIDIGVSNDTQTYRFETLWMGLNQKNHQKYIQTDELGQQHMLERVLIGNILSFFKSMNHFVDDQIQVKGTFREKNTKFKGNRMVAFDGMFSANVMLPNYIGLGKSVSRGFGTVRKQED